MCATITATLKKDGTPELKMEGSPNDVLRLALHIQREAAQGLTDHRQRAIDDFNTDHRQRAIDDFNASRK